MPAGFSYQDLHKIAYKLIDRELVHDRVHDLACMLGSEAADHISLFWITNGALPFVSALWRAEGLFRKKDLLVEAVHARNYRGITPVGLEHDAQRIDFDAHRGRRIIVLDDILDQGTTLNNVVQCFRERLPGAVIEIATLVHKAGCDRHNVPLKHCGFTIHGKPWLIGFGMDHFGYYRTEPSIWMLKREMLPLGYSPDNYPAGPHEVRLEVDGVHLLEWQEERKKRRNGRGE